MRECKVDEKILGRWIERAESEIWFIAPAITEPLAQKIIDADNRTGQNSCVLITLDDAMDRHGYGETKGVRLLMDEGKNIKHANGILISALVIKHDICAVWAPVAERVDSIERVSINGFLFEKEEEMEAFQYRIQKLLQVEQSQPNENQFDNKEIIKVVDVSEEEIKVAEKNLVEHPPRDFKDEKKLEVYSAYIGFIEIQLTGSSLAKSTTLSIPKEYIEIGLNENARKQLTEKLRLDLSKHVDIGVPHVKNLVDAFRKTFTRKLGKPIGRVYRKKDWETMEKELSTINNHIDEANRNINKILKKAVEHEINEYATKWFESNSSKTQENTKDKLIEILNKRWEKQSRPTKLELECITKDLTWVTLNDENIQNQIELEYPEICETGMFKSKIAYS